MSLPQEKVYVGLVMGLESPRNGGDIVILLKKKAREVSD
jgi:hypothetical protein